jgi:hypothetical protein
MNYTRRPPLIERAQETLSHLSSNGKLTEAQREKFIDLVTNTNAESRERWAASRWYVKAWWRTKERVRSWFGLVTRMPYHVSAIVKMRPGYNPRVDPDRLNKLKGERENES